MNISKSELEKLKCILGSEYENVKEFFYNVCTSKFDFKILITRRSYVLFKIFKSIFENFPCERLSQPQYEVIGTICNTHSLEQLTMLNEALDDKTFLIVDDIVINGRTINNIYETLVSLNIPKHHIKIWVIACNEGALCLDENIETLFGHVIYVCGDEWKALSTSLTQFVVQSNVGYVSFVNSYILKDVSIQKITNSFIAQGLKDRIFENTNLNFQKASICSNVVFCDFENSQQIENFEVCSCIRFYESSDKLIAIPYIFLPTLKKNDVYSYCLQLLSSLGLKVPNFFINNERQIEVSLYHWTVKTLGDLLIEEWCEKLSILNCEKYFSCDESFLFDKSLYGNIECTTTQYSYNVVLNSENEYMCSETLKKNLSKSKSLSENIKTYFKIMRRIDEDRARNGAERYLGIRIFDIENALQSQEIEYNKFKLLSILIGLWDCGKASLVILEDFDENNSVIDGYLRHGEQIFVVYYEMFSRVYNVFYELLCETFETRKQELQKIAMYFNEKYNTTLFKDFVDGIDQTQYVTDLMAIPPYTIENNFIVKDARNEIRDYFKQILKKEKA